MAGLRNYHFAHKGNRWGDELVTISVENTSTIVHWGITNAQTGIPDLTNSVVL